MAQRLVERSSHVLQLTVPVNHNIRVTSIRLFYRDYSTFATRTYCPACILNIPNILKVFVMLKYTVIGLQYQTKKKLLACVLYVIYLELFLTFKYHKIDPNRWKDCFYVNVYSCDICGLYQLLWQHSHLERKTQEYRICFS